MKKLRPRNKKPHRAPPESRGATYIWSVLPFRSWGRGRRVNRLDLMAAHLREARSAR